MCDDQLEEEGSTEGTSRLSGNHERQEASRETEMELLGLVIERDFLSKAFGR